MCLRVDFEWNPFSAASRAGRAERAGRIGDALRLYAKAGQSKHIFDCLRYALSGWPVQHSLAATARELLGLQKATADARCAVLQEAMRRRLLDDTQAAADMLWATAERNVASAALASDASQLSEGVAREIEKLDRLLGTMREARNKLASLLLSGGSGDLQAVERTFQELANVAQSLEEEADELTSPQDIQGGLEPEPIGQEDEVPEPDRDAKGDEGAGSLEGAGR